jgi:hypothetical protein
MEKINGKHIGALISAACLAALLCAGCASDKAPIVFSDEATAPKAAKDAAVAENPGLSKADQIKIEMQVLGDLLTRHFWDDGEYTAIFIQCDDAQLKMLQNKFPKHKPPIKPNYLADLRPNQMPRDRDTGRGAMILSVDVNEPEPDGTVQAIGRWYAGGAVTGFYTFVLKPKDGDWEIQNEP